MFRINTEDRPLYGKIAKLTGPIILQNLLSAAVIVPLGIGAVKLIRARAHTSE